MPERFRGVLIVGILVLVFLAVFVGLRAWRLATPQALPESLSAAPEAPTAVAVPPPALGETGPPAAGDAGREATAAVTAGRGTPEPPSADSPRTTWKARPAVEFGPADLAGAAQGVRVDLGRYAAAVGQEFEVRLGLSAPALESVTLALRYDPQALAMVPGSVAPVGTGFRGGVEAYAPPAGGRLTIIHAGIPGRKNLDAVMGDVVVWRMQALRAGETRLELLADSSFTNGRGGDETYEVTGGEVTVR